MEGPSGDDRCPQVSGAHYGSSLESLPTADPPGDAHCLWGAPRHILGLQEFVCRGGAPLHILGFQESVCGGGGVLLGTECIPPEKWP